jgi:anti-anti-sigma factor
VEHGPESPLQIDVSQGGVVVTVIVAGEVDITTASALSRSLLIIGAARPERLILDLNGLVFVDAAGARALDEAYTLLQTVCPVLVRQPRPAARKVIGIAGLMDD